MKKTELSYKFPDHLIATERKALSRVMLVENHQPSEITLASLLNLIEPDDVLVINDTKVIKARVFSTDDIEVLFIKSDGDLQWSVLFPAKKLKLGHEISMPGGLILKLIEKGLPQKVETNFKITLDYFHQFGDIPLPPYIQQARGERRSRKSDQEMYQTAWADQWGSLAAPTASLHFSKNDLDKVKKRGAKVLPLTLHVGLGTFLPIHSDDINDHQMHFEYLSLPKTTLQQIKECQKNRGRVWALGSTVVRALESYGGHLLTEGEADFFGESNLFIKPGYDFKIVDVMMTNFHQPESTLLAMVMAFAGQENVRKCYEWAIERNFRLFSYGDLSVWIK